MIVTGVDMGRSFSVLLFCVAMDPVLTYLNRIPGMLTVQGYVDDTTMAGDTTTGMQWLTEAWDICTRLRSAGIQIDEHKCWRAGGIHMHGNSSGQIDQHPALKWTQALAGHATLRKALISRAGSTVTTIVCRGNLFQCLTPQEVDRLLAGDRVPTIDPLLLVQCKCSNKCSILVNHPASQTSLNAIERANWGAHLIEGKTTALGLLLYGKFQWSNKGWQPVEELTGTQAINPKALAKANQRLALFSTPAHSIVQRSLANNILSLNIYQSTYFGFNWNDINLYQQRSSRLLLGRPWLVGRYLPHIFRWLGIAPAIDPAVTLTAACIGYWLRQNGPVHLLSPGDPVAETRQGAVVQQIFWAWIPLLGTDKIAALLRIIAGQYTRRQHFQFLKQLKISLYQTLLTHALQYLKARVSEQILPGGVSWAWLNKLSTIPKMAIHGVARFAVLRWAVNEDDDECLRLRVTGSLQAERPCALCGTRTQLYPLGLQAAPACEKCCHEQDINATTLPGPRISEIPVSSPWSKLSNLTCRSYSVPAAWPLHLRDLPPCIACGNGDNSAHHWARFCVVPLLVATALSPESCVGNSLDQIGRSSTTGCVIASHVLHQYRRLLLEHGGMQHSPSTVPLSIAEWLNRLYDNCVQAIPTRYLYERLPQFQLQQEDSSPAHHPCLMQVTNNEAVTLQAVMLPDLMCTATTAISSCQTIATLPLGHPWLRLISPSGPHAQGLQPNARIVSQTSDTDHPSCTVSALRPIGANEMILAHRPRATAGAPATQLVGQFDGSCHRTEQLGGAGYVLYTVSAGESRVLACRAVALPNCSDKIEAEILACRFLIEEMSIVARRIAATDGTFPIVVIQGDILPVVKYFQFAGRLRRLDMTNPLEQIRVTVSLHIPHALFLYQSRVSNIVADNLAGQASNFIRERYHRCPAEYNRHGGREARSPSAQPSLPPSSK